MLSGLAALGFSHFAFRGLCEIKDALARRLVDTKTFEDRRAHFDLAALAFVSPLGELDFSNQFRLYEMNAAGALRLPEEWGSLHRKFFEFLPHRGMGFVAKAGAGLTDGDQAALVVIETEDKRSEVLAAALGIGVAADDTFLPLRDLDLEPLAAAFGEITAAAALGDDAFKSALASGFVERE